MNERFSLYQSRTGECTDHTRHCQNDKLVSAKGARGNRRATT